MTAAVAFLLSLVTAALLTPAVRGVALRRGWLDGNASSRKIHGTPVPRLGGIAIVLAFFAPLACLLVVETGLGQAFVQDGSRVFGLFAGGLAIAALGIYDDLRGANARQKLAVQTAVAVAMYALGFRIELLANPFGAELTVGAWVGFPLTVLWIVGVINALNLIDGLDGLAGGVALFAIVVSLVIALIRGDALMTLYGAALAGSLIGFLLYNFNPATIFMGDTGSMFLGFVLAVTALQRNQKSSTAVALLIPMVALGLPLLDTGLAIVRRAANGRPLFSADREHIHHRLLGLGLSQRQAALALYGFCCFLALAALALTWANSAQTAGILALVGVLTVALGRLVGVFKLSRLRDAFVQRQRNGDRRAAVRATAARLREARSLDEADAALAEFGRTLGAQHARLLGPIAAVPPAGEVSVRIELPGTATGDRTLEVTWTDGRTAIDRDDEIAIEEVAASLRTALERLAARPDARLARLSG